MAKLKPDYINWVLNLNASQAQEEYHKLSQLNKELQKQTTATRKAMADLEAQGKKGSVEWRNLVNSINQNNRAMNENRRKMDEVSKQFDLSGMTVAQLKKRLKELNKEFANTSKSLNPKRYKELQDQINKTRDALDDATGKTRQMTQESGRLAAMGGKLKGFFMGIVAMLTMMVAGGFKNAVSTIIDFEKANSRLAAILGSTKEGIKQLTEEARRLGATTSFTASEVTSLQTELAKLGFSQNQIVDMTADVLKFASAVGTDLGSAASFAGASMRMFRIDSADVGDMLASLAISTNRSALDFSFLSSAMSTVGPVAKSFGFSIQETVALLGNLANAGFDASSAATATRNILLNLADPGGKLAKALGGPVKNLDELTAGLKKLENEGISLAKALDITDKRSVAAFSNFLAGADDIATLRDSITDVKGAFYDMSAEMGDNVQGSLNILSSTIEGLVLKFYESRGALKSLIDGFTALLEWSGKVLGVIGDNLKLVGLMIAAWASYRVGLLATLAVKKLYVAATKSGTAASAAELALTKAEIAANKLHRAGILALAMAKAVFTGNVQKAAVAHRLFMATMSVSPITLLIGAITLAVSAYAMFRKKAKEVSSMQKSVAEANERAAESYANQRSEIDSLILVAKNEQLSLRRRRDAIAQLNKIVPGYNAEIDATTGKYKASTRALNKYLESLEKEARYKANKEQYEKLIAEEERKRQKSDEITERNNKKIRELRKQKENVGKSGYRPDSHAGRLGAPMVRNDKRNKIDQEIQELTDEIDSARFEWKHARAISSKFKKRINDGLSSGIMAAPVNTEVEDPEPESPDVSEEELERRRKKAEEERKRREQEAEKAAKETEKAEKEAYKKRMKDEEYYYSQRLAAVDAFYSEQESIIRNRARQGEIPQEAADLYILDLQRRHHAKSLEELQAHYDALEDVGDMDADEWRRKRDELAADMRKINNQMLDDTGKWAEKMNELSQRTDPESMRVKHESQVAALMATYDTAIRLANDAGRDTDDLVAARDERIRKLNFDYRQQLWELKEITGLSWSEEFEKELEQLKYYRDQELITEKQYQEAKLKMQVDNVKKYYDYYSGLASDMFSAIQDAEISASEAKYDALIRQAQNNGEETADLEREKENKKLEIQKKYADVNFAIKISQIIADTAVAMMQTYAQFGFTPWGIAAAAMLTATGIAQVMTAKAERDKIKNLQPDNGGGSSPASPAPSASRVLTGYSEGGYTGDGGRYEVAGLVHRGEYVVPKPIMKDPRVVDAVGTIEAIRRNRVPSVAGRHAGSGGYADGGYTDVAAYPDFTEFVDAVRLFRQAAKHMKAYVVYQDLERSEEALNRARNPFTKD